MIKQILTYFKEVKAHWNDPAWYDFEHDMWFSGNMDEELEKVLSPTKDSKLTAKLIATCVYCGREFNSHQEIQQHIEVCEKAPKDSKEGL